MSLHAEQLTLPRHGSIHTELLPYTPLMHWIRALDHRAYQHLNKTYASSISKLYERDIRLFFEEARQRISGGRRCKYNLLSQQDGERGKIYPDFDAAGSTEEARNVGRGVSVVDEVNPIVGIGLKELYFIALHICLEQQGIDMGLYSVPG